MRPEPYAFLGVRVGAYTIDDLHAVIGEAVAADARIVIANHNMHSVALTRRDAKFRAFFDVADVTHVDGMPLVPLGRMLGAPLTRAHRVTYVDWVPALMAEAERRRWRVFSLGGRPGVGERGAAVLRERHPALEIETAHGYFDQRAGGAESEAVLGRIAAFAPHVLLVGLGMPRQEHWAYDHRGRIAANATLMAGAALDYVAGAVPTPPRWAGRWSLEWAFRLVAEPKRLGQRYLIEPWPVLGLFVREWTTRALRGEG
ncbi:MAG TPA: WecB/TagA/CpsF family glycosyltransferase [Gemmatimonadaceae bacterium]|jgi:N-acetylglucosaminyldiphosphoundecaprenol N-acetyl-beta-D-mannosaminyltransferase|nr:WecB/TagA/CpsF family glycosyltransferase [Gemmatimonadaceae bacterium]